MSSPSNCKSAYKGVRPLLLPGQAKGSDPFCCPDGFLEKSILMVLLAFLFVPGCCKEPDPRFSTPEKAAHLLADSVKSNSYKDFRECLTRVENEQINEEMFRDLVSAWSGRLDVEESTKILEDKGAVLRLRMYYNPGRGPGGARSMVIRTQWALEDGEWKIDFSRCDSLPFVALNGERELE